MSLMTQQLRKQIPPLRATEEQRDPVAYARFFTPDSSWTWYVFEYDGEDTCFGYVIGHFAELGHFSLAELESVRGPLGLKIERDLYFSPVRLSEVRERERPIP